MVSNDSNKVSASEERQEERTILETKPRILHLLLFTLIEALFIAWFGSQIETRHNFVLYELSAPEVITYGIGISCCWTGLVIALISRNHFASANYRFDPGEWICVAEGLYFAFAIGLNAMLNAIDTGAAIFLRQASTMYFVLAVFLALGYLRWLRSLDKGAWKLAALLKSIAHFVGPLLLIFLVITGFGSPLYLVAQSAIMAVYLISTLAVCWAAMVTYKARYYRWTHWLGVFAFSLIYLTRVVTEIRVLLIDGG